MPALMRASMVLVAALGEPAGGIARRDQQLDRVAADIDDGDVIGCSPQEYTEHEDTRKDRILQVLTVKSELRVPWRSVWWITRESVKSVTRENWWGDQHDEFAFQAGFAEAGLHVGGGADEEGFVESW